MRVMVKKYKQKIPTIDLEEETIGQRLSRLRKERGLTQIELAHQMGLVQALISDYERGRLRLHDEIIIKFAKALNVNSDEILGIDQSEKTQDKPSLRLVRRMKKIETLPKSKQRTLIETIDNFLKGVEK